MVLGDVSINGGLVLDGGWARVGDSRKEFYFEEYTFTVELSADEVPVTRDAKKLPRLEIP